jgi:hypothetical protein
MNKIIRRVLIKINDYIGIKSGVKIKKVTYSRPCTLKAKEIFKNKPIRVIEIGCAAGNNALDVLKNLNVTEYIIIDPYDKSETDYDDYDKSRLIAMREEAKKKLRNYSDKLVWIYDFSDNAIGQIEGKIDYIYIDGNHSYDFVRSDLENYSKLLAETFVFGGHDIDQPGVTKAFVEFISKKGYELYEINDPDWLIYGE